MSERSSHTPTANSASIRVIVTGGTFDKEYDELKGQLSFTRTHVAEMLKLGRSRLAIAIDPLMLIDSLEMTDADRARIVERCAEAPESHLVITHGTDTMCETAASIATSPDGRLRMKTIVLTGAMIPYTFGSSDGLFNLGSALSFVQVLPAGIYVAMNGQYFDWNEVRKNRESGVFERIERRS
jgi:L-asparaginase